MMKAETPSDDRSAPSGAAASVRSYLRRHLPRPAYRAARKTYYGARIVARRNPGRGRVLPDFVVIGAAKSGTTSLYASLIEHPFVVPCSTTNAYFSNTKEVRYFDYNFGRGRTGTGRTSRCSGSAKRSPQSTGGRFSPERPALPTSRMRMRRSASET